MPGQVYKVEKFAGRERARKLAIREHQRWKKRKLVFPAGDQSARQITNKPAVN